MMHWENMETFWAMGGYGTYVWGAYGITALGIAFELILLRRDRHQRMARLQRLKKWEDQ